MVLLIMHVTWLYAQPLIKTTIAQYRKNKAGDL